MSKHLRLRCPLGILAFLLSIWGATTKPAAGQQAPSENNPADSVHGVVVNSVTHEPVGRALVYSPDSRFATMTDGEGRFEFTFPHAEASENKENQPESTDQVSSPTQNRPDQLIARKPGFLNDQNGTVNPQSDITGKDLTISLTPEALIVGRVVLPTSEASDTIQLAIYQRQVRDGRTHSQPAGSASSRSNGEFRFAELSTGTYKLLTRELMDSDPLLFDPSGQVYGYPPVYFPNATDFAAAQTIELRAGQVFQANITLVKHPYYPVKVAVTNAQPRVAINVVVSVLGHRGPGFAVGYNYRDQTIEGSLPNGNYTLEARSYGTNIASGLLNISVQGAALEGPRMTLVPNGSIAVNVKEEFTSTQDTNPQGANVIDGPRENDQKHSRYLNVFLEPADDFGHENGVSLRPPAGPDDDSLVLDGVQPGRYWVRATSSRGFVAAISSGTTDLQHHLLVVGLGGSSSPIDITMRDGTAELDGTVEGAATTLSAAEGPTPFLTAFARPPGDGSFAHVYCVPLPDSSGEFREIWVSQDGKFGPQQLPPGTYRVLAFQSTQPELEYRSPEAMRAYETKGQVVRLVAGQQEHLRLQLIPSSE